MSTKLTPEEMKKLNDDIQEGLRNSQNIRAMIEIRKLESRDET